MRLTTFFATLYTLSLIVFSGDKANADIIAELKDIDLGELSSIGIDITLGGEFQVEAVGIRANWNDDDFIAYAWIIDHKTRELVWTMRDRDSERVRRGEPLRSQNDVITLDKGKYEIYYYSADLFNGIRINYDFDDDDDYDDDFFGKFGNVFGGNKSSRRYIRKYLRDCHVKISSEGSSSRAKTFEVSGDLPNALLRKNRLGDSEYVKWGFTLDKAMSLRIYTVFEFPRGNRSPVDYAWIVDADSRERVWEIDRWETERAGGGRKNRMFDGEVEFPAGNYILHFVTDDSHSFDRFNKNPPFDPYNWGITVLPGSGFQQAAFHEYEPPSRGEALIDFSRARDDDYFEQAFRISRPVTLHVYALGEASGNEFVDYGWIEDVSSHRTVWEMNKRNTEYAGGGRKNRMFDGPIDLPSGDYIAYYITDGSHSYRDWNASPPFEPGAWGMTISVAAGNNASYFSKIPMSDITSDSEVLVALTKVRDNQRRRAKFTLKERSTVRIYAIGEGTGRDMADYAWIIDDKTGRDVWEMRYRSTRHAGGAKKNRKIEDEVTLDAGTYVVFYITDGSHAFNDWNATRPRDFRNWGVTISLAEH